jgi:2-dehydro-3-deoxyphosphogluconate aldolase/(4S)-4-hydroxy-2-oxoglutarate aldolase
MPTGGVNATRESLEEWFTAGVTCVGIGSNLVTKDVIANKDYKALTKNVKQVVGWIEEIRADLA